MTELAGQTGGRAVTHLVVAAGSLGTVAGPILGTWATGMHCDGQAGFFAEDDKELA